MTLADIYTKDLAVKPGCLVKVYPSRNAMLHNKTSAVYHYIDDVPYPEAHAKEVTYYAVTEKGNILVTFGGWD